MNKYYIKTLEGELADFTFDEISMMYDLLMRTHVNYWEKEHRRTIDSIKTKMLHAFYYAQEERKKNE